MKEKIYTNTFVDVFLQRWRAYLAYKFVMQNDIVCDMGCGYDAYFLKKIAHKIKNGVGFDLDIRPRKEKNILIDCIDLSQKIPLEDKSVDVITALAFIEHAENPKFVLGEWKRILKDGGRLIITTPSPRARLLWEWLLKVKLINQSNDASEHKQYFSRNDLISLIQEEGFFLIRHKYFQFGFNNLIVAEK